LCTLRSHYSIKLINFTHNQQQKACEVRTLQKRSSATWSSKASVEYQSHYMQWMILMQSGQYGNQGYICADINGEMWSARIASMLGSEYCFFSPADNTRSGMSDQEICRQNGKAPEEITTTNSTGYDGGGGVPYRLGLGPVHMHAQRLRRRTTIKWRRNL
jgi:hypothetical protein